MITTEAVYSKQVLLKYYEEVQTPLYVGIEGLEYTLNTEKYLEKVKPSGVILMGGNIQDKKQVKELISDIHSYAKSKGISIKIAIDEEGGLVSRLKTFPEYPDNFQGILENDQTKIDQQIKILADIGIDINFAPVADIAYEATSIMQGRSAGNTEEKVTERIIPYANKLEEVGIIPTLKHFPGLGRTNRDTHTDFANIDINYQEWLESDAKPYKTAQEKIPNYAVMLGHVTYPQVDKYPASISPKWVEILRKEILFKGPIFTDDLKMEGIQSDSRKYMCEKIDISKQEYEISLSIKQSLDAGVNHPLIILTQSETEKVFNNWIRIEKGCR